MPIMFSGDNSIIQSWISNQYKHLRQNDTYYEFSVSNINPDSIRIKAEGCGENGGQACFYGSSRCEEVHTLSPEGIKLFSRKGCPDLPSFVGL